MRPSTVLLATVALTAPLALSAQTLDLPLRKAGLWELTTTVEKPKALPPIASKVCLDPATDRELMDYGLKLTDGKCRSHMTKRDGRTLVIEAECTVGGKMTRSKVTITGDFQSAYTMQQEGTVERGGDKPPVATRMTHIATWKSADCPGMKPGDMTLFGGVKVNVKQMKALSGMIR